MTTPAILLFATHSYAGMGPYVISIINSFRVDDNVFFFLVEAEDRYYSNNINPTLKEKAFILTKSSPSKLRTLYHTLGGFRITYSNILTKFLKDKNITIVHNLTGTSDYRLVKHFSKSFKWLFTVHDVNPHEAKKSFIKEWKQNRAYKAIFKAIESTPFLITNGNTQFEELKYRYPSKKCYLTPFPTLITDKIHKGVKKVPELKDINKYILFFGRIEEYKGLSLLINAFEGILGFEEVKLVIAGKGELAQTISDSRIVFLNRYIDDQEIKDLYTNSLFVVYPYISATQSGVLSIASYFETPIICSDVPFFIETLGFDYPGLFRVNDYNSLREIMVRFLIMEVEEKNNLKRILHELYRRVYSNQTQRKTLLSVYENL